LAKNELNIKIFSKIIFLVIKIRLMVLFFAIFLKLGQTFVLKYDFFTGFFLNKNIGT